MWAALRIPLSQADNPTAIVGGRPCVPGSTLKGALRAKIERWLLGTAYDPKQNKWHDEELKPCVPSTRLSNDEKRLVEENRYRGKSCSYGGSDRGQEKNGEKPKTICPVCYLLGAQGLVGFVSVPFLFAEPGYQNLYSSSIDRASGTVKSGTNRPYQLVPPGAKFVGELEILLENGFLGWKLGSPRPLRENPNADAWLKNEQYEPEALASFVVDRLASIGYIGGYRSKGCGRVEISVKKALNQANAESFRGNTCA
ncbi:MAG: RAMP superfamily CRISPR-associated protein [Armatimonadetes bacterium]|nr:RAMP superfamily CRISPR-associated protein [Armatimonadota bacterium]